MLHERGNTQRLSQQVNWLLFSVNGKDINQSRLDPFTEVVVFLVAITSAGSHLGGLGNMDCTSIIFKELAVNGRFGGRQLHPMLFHLLEEVHQDNGNPKTLRQTNILAFSSGEDHFSLQLRGPCDGTPLTYPVLDLAVEGSFIASSLTQLPAKSQST
jgi:hypothetical protein